MQSGRYDRNHEHIKLKSPQNSCSWALICLQDNIRCSWNSFRNGWHKEKAMWSSTRCHYACTPCKAKNLWWGHTTSLPSSAILLHPSWPFPEHNTQIRSLCILFNRNYPSRLFLNLIYWGKTCILFTSPQVVLVCFISFHSCFLPVFRPSCFAMLWVSSFC